MPHRILVQAGHFPPMQPGHETQTGAPGERDLVRDIQLALVDILKDDDRFVAVPVPGRIPSGVQVDAALYLHADGVTSPIPRGYSFGYPDFAVNKRLALLIADEFERLPGHPPRRVDNGTKDEHFYYGFHHVDTPGPEVLVEHGFVTNPAEHAWLLQNVKTLAHAEYRALCRFFGLPLQGGMASTTLSVKPHATSTPVRRAANVRLALTTSDAPLRQGPDRDAPSRGLILKGAEVTVTAANGSWRRVAVTGWIHASRLSERPRPATPAHTPGSNGHAVAVPHVQPHVDTGSITTDTTLFAAPRTTPEHAERFLLAQRHGEYTDDDVRRIVGLYFETSTGVGLDPLVAIAQMSHETGHLTSFWSQRPRRNPAGIGVTGDPGEGLSFPDWPTAVVAHVGRLIAYGLAKGAGTGAQKKLIADALSFRPLPSVYRGAVHRLGDFGHGVWGADPEYAGKLVATANAIRSA